MSAPSTLVTTATSTDLIDGETIAPVWKPGTIAVSIVPYEETDAVEKYQYEVITAQPECSAYSLEEHRLADYILGLGVEFRDRDEQGSTPRLAKPFSKRMLPTNRTSKEHLKLLRGEAIEVHVGEIPCSCKVPCGCSDSWFLSKGLISRYSSSLEAACTRDFKERSENKIQLPDDDLEAFALFVEWMYYGKYNVATQVFSGEDDTYDDTNIHARCWILGDKLLSSEFKNYAMSQLYAQCMAKSAFEVVTTQDVQYACENSAEESRLRQFYFAYVVEHFATPMRLRGKTEEWDELLLHHADLRAALLQSFRSAPEDRLTVGAEMVYLDYDEPLENTFSMLRIEGGDA
ncbi:hypothetical protein N0V83_000624 [Neocucurbitaria cava]|uniref:BTB domain-containing protein n=1 Tax=Neocucurbitaria cava TaxID=798079 RepID=A0A9W8YHM6_9PLEO|nr:hypothetical protein N0V83_000624 [Neocucurbitaria cava]